MDIEYTGFDIYGWISDIQDWIYRVGYIGLDIKLDIGYTGLDI